MGSADRRRVAVIGAGIIGLAAAYHLCRDGAEVVVLDRDPDGDRASMGNAGGIAVTEVCPAATPGVWWRAARWLADPLGPLAIRPAHAPWLIPWLMRFARSARPAEAERISQALAALNGRVYDDLVPLLVEVGLDGELRRTGALSVYLSAEAYRRDSAEWACKRARGMVCEELSGAEIRRLEPALSKAASLGVFTPQWSHLDDPARLVRALRRWLAKQGVAVLQGEARNIVPCGERWRIETLGGSRIEAGHVVVAAGAWSGALARRLGDRVLLESERGYNTTLPASLGDVGRQLIFPEHKFVATPLRCGLRIGGAAEFGGLRAGADFRRSQVLLELARRYLPELDVGGGSMWAGHRPTTPDSLPVIGASPRSPQILYAFGHGHLGLTQAATTGRLLADLVAERIPPIRCAPFAIARFAR